MKRYIVEHQFISDIDSSTICTAEHGITYKTLKEAAEGQAEHIGNSDYYCVGFRIIELREVEHDDH